MLRSATTTCTTSSASAYVQEKDTTLAVDLTILRTCCHGRYTEAEQLSLGSGLVPTIESQVSPRVKLLLNRTPQPPQVVWGRRTALHNLSSAGAWTATAAYGQQLRTGWT